jgi:signal transduction histidine kinase
VDRVWRDLLSRKGGERSTNENVTKDGGTILCEWYNTPLITADGGVIGVASLVQDITERKRAEEEILKLNAELEQRVVRRTVELQKKTQELGEANNRLKELDRLKSMFIASMSHELRTPLNSIIGFSSITLEEWTGPLNDEQKKNLATVLRSGRHLLALINDIIDISKIEAGKHEVSIDDFDLHYLIEDAVSLFRKEIGEKGLELNAESPHLDMSTDRRRLLQCMVNLVGNAVKFTERGRIEIKINLVKSSDVLPAPDIVEIGVSDTGIGMKKEDLPKLFTAFTRIPSHLSMKVRGTGLGLYLVKKIATEILKGDVTVQSTLGEGSSFCLRIPIKL